MRHPQWPHRARAASRWLLGLVLSATASTTTQAQRPAYHRATPPSLPAGLHVDKFVFDSTSGYWTVTYVLAQQPATPGWLSGFAIAAEAPGVAGSLRVVGPSVDVLGQSGAPPMAKTGIPEVVAQAPSRAWRIMLDGDNRIVMKTSATAAAPFGSALVQTGETATGFSLRFSVLPLLRAAQALPPTKLPIYNDDTGETTDHPDPGVQYGDTIPTLTIGPGLPRVLLSPAVIRQQIDLICTFGAASRSLCATRSRLPGWNTGAVAPAVLDGLLSQIGSDPLATPAVKRMVPVLRRVLVTR